MGAVWRRAADEALSKINRWFRNSYAVHRCPWRLSYPDLSTIEKARRMPRVHRNRIAVYISLGVAAAAATTWAMVDRTAYRDCMHSIHVDVMPMPGETWESQAARMDADAHDHCKKWLYAWSM